MSSAALPPAIRLRGVRHNNLKNFDLELPLNQLVVVTGPSGSGKSSLAFDTLYAEGQRRYIETFSPYARQFLDRMDKPRVDSIDGIPPAIALEQRNTVRTSRSTVGTMTEICDLMKLLWPQVARLHCRQCGKPVRKDSPHEIWALLTAACPNQDILVTFDLALTAGLSLRESLALVRSQGYQRLLVDGRVVSIDEAEPPLQATQSSVLTVVQDRLRISEASRARLVEACEQAYHFGKGKLAVLVQPGPEGPMQGGQVLRRLFSNRLHCAICDIEYREPSPALFSYNHPMGACPACRGFGRTITVDYNLVIPDRSRTLAQGVVKPWQTGLGAECQQDMMKFCRRRKVPMNVPFEKMAPEWQSWVLDGDPDYGKDALHEWPRAWYGVKGYFRWLESKAYKMHIRVQLSRYRAYQICPSCGGARFQPESLLYRARLPSRIDIDDLPPREITLANFYQLPLEAALNVVRQLGADGPGRLPDPIRLVLSEVESRLTYLVDIGLEYLTLDRPTRTLSGGETERVNLTACLGTHLVNTLFVLDEPSVGLHARDTDRLVRQLDRLRNLGNTVVVVEHEARVIRASDHIVDLGPGHGETGGEVVFQGTLGGLLRHSRSLTGQYLNGTKLIDIPRRRPVSLNDGPGLVLEHATRHNLKDLTVRIPLGRFVCVTGVSGSGKTTLVRETLLPAIEARLRPTAGSSYAGRREPDERDRDADESLELGESPESAALRGWEALGQVMLVDQSPIGRTPRSNPAVYIGAFDAIRRLFADWEESRFKDLGASAFSFNSRAGQCERCRGAGFEKIEMQFLSDVFVRCPHCQGQRYRSKVLEVRLTPNRPSDAQTSPRQSWNIADMLESSVEGAIEFLAGFTASPHAERAIAALEILREIGLGYLRLGQPVNTLSGGESQRLKLAAHLAEARRTRLSACGAAGAGTDRPDKPTLFMFDEPTTGLHFDDVRVLLQLLQRLVDAGHSVLVIEHNLELIKCADWIIDLGPESGDKGGWIVAEGPPELVAADRTSHTGAALLEVGIRPAG